MVLSWGPEGYHRYSSAQAGWAHELIRTLTISGNERVLDLGCGEGKITAAIARLVPRGRVVGMDFSPDMIRFAREHYPAGDYPNLSFEQGDMRKIRFKESFDLVFSNAALHWVDDHLAVLRGIHQALVPGGRVLLQMGGTGNIRDLEGIVHQIIRKEPWKNYFIDFQEPYRFCGPVEYRLWMHEAGLIPVRIELIPKDMVQEDRERLAGWIRTTWLPFLERLPDRLREAFIDAIIDTRSQHLPADSEGRYHIAMVRLEVEAMKDEPGSIS